MTEEDKKRIFGYMGWCPKTRNFCNGKARATFCPTLDDCHQHPLDGNDMVAAMNKIVEKREWDKFAYLVKINLPYEVSFIEDIIHWLMQPTRFFELMSSWLKEKENEKS